MKAPTTATPPVTFTDANAPIVVGLSPRQLRTFVREHRVPHARVGRRILVRVDRFLEAVDLLSGAQPRTAWSEDALIKSMAGRGAA